MLKIDLLHICVKNIKNLKITVGLLYFFMVIKDLLYQYQYSDTILSYLPDMSIDGDGMVLIH